ncbi:hypothetical protein ACLKA6_012207 [Drosophila palustris]
MKKAASEAATTATVTTATIQRSAIRVMSSQRKCTQLRNACRASWQRGEEEEELQHKAGKVHTLPGLFGQLAGSLATSWTWQLFESSNKYELGQALLSGANTYINFAAIVAETPFLAVRCPCRAFKFLEQ